uniref:Predicted protein n=1 Tax=Physcomitrium patens TaxID=3218 RepID=A9U481_PHYPA
MTWCLATNVSGKQVDVSLDIMFVRNAKIKVLSSLSLETKEELEDWERLADSLKVNYPNYLQLMVEILNKMYGSQGIGEAKFSVAKVIKAADNVIRLVDTGDLARYFSMKNESEDANAAKVRKEMEKKRDSLADALYKKGLALIQLEEDQTTQQKEVHEASSTEALDGASTSVKNESSQLSAPITDTFEETYAELRKWADINLPKYLLLTVKREKRSGRLGNAFKFLNDLIQDESKPPQKSLFELRIKLLEELEWPHLAEYERKWQIDACILPNCADGSKIQECNSSVNLWTMCLPEHLYLQPLIQLRLLDTTHCFFELFLISESHAVALETEKSVQGIC